MIHFSKKVGSEPCRSIPKMWELILFENFFRRTHGKYDVDILHNRQFL
ncbi:hypothetical protein LEP1GSC041_0374 [Leptospira noguchii str. 2006001870]|uniref:Uncharacterized protein n=2 Tax=Leptospira noguchii TaxID=28182 RepID=T0FJ88_9LEPT|nr:hypothetical protein LEP1GSC041_0374 [Leptospira noguchii str. 2006001870]EMO54497.1 hypothetical protein LEP1GSC172_2746 [Leptospira noguchii]EQA73463.1 hypothetical protein LEP1GSC059_0429 [Leptospira noguchii serovar Panama str. CZ214]